MRSPVLLQNLIAFLAVVLVLYALLAIAIYLAQDRLLYFPDIVTRRQTVETASRLGLKLWPDETGDYHGLVSVTPPAMHRGTVLVWHGNAGSAIHRVHYAQALQRLGFRVVLIEYPGYGSRSGDVGETFFVRDARKAARMAKQEFGGPLYVWGESLGCGVANAVAAEPELKVQGAVMLTPWDTLPNLAQRLYWYLPVKWSIRDRYDNVRNLAGFQGPVAVLMAGRDEVIPNKHTMRLYESLSGEKQIWVFAEAGHNTWPASPDARWWAEVMAFMAQAHASQSLVATSNVN